MIPGFIPRLQAEIARVLDIPSSPQPQPSKNRKPRLRLPPYHRYAPLRQLLPYFAILNNPDPLTEENGSTQKKSNAAGKAPAFTPACMTWVGGSLAGYVSPSGVYVVHAPTNTLLIYSQKVIKNWRRRDTQREMGGSGCPRGSRDGGRGCHDRTFLTNLTGL